MTGRTNPGVIIKTVKGYTIVKAADVEDVYEGTDVPGEFRPLKEALEAEQVAVTHLHIPPHSDFEQGTGHYHDEVEEIYIVSRGTLTMRFGDDVVKVPAGSVARVAPGTPRSHRNEDDEAVDLWAISRKIDFDDAHLIEVFWQASKRAAQKRP